MSEASEQIVSDQPLNKRGEDRDHNENREQLIITASAGGRSI